MRNSISRKCGLIIFASQLTLTILSLTHGSEPGTTNLTLFLETIMLLAFGISWLVKGKTLFADKPDEKRFNLTMVQNSVECKNCILSLISNIF